MLTFQGSTPFVAYADETNEGKLTVRRLISGVWQDVGTNGIVSTAGFDNAIIGFSGTTPYVAYMAEKNEELNTGSEDEQTRLFVKSFNGTNWIPVPAASNGIVVDEAVTAFSFAVSPAGVPHIAYIYFSELDSDIEDPNEGKIFVKKYESGSWIDVGSAISPTNLTV